MIKKTNLLVIVLLLIGFKTYAQFNTYHFRATIEGVNDQWQSLTLNHAVFEHIKSDFNDIRIITITNNGDTIEIPYIRKVFENKQENIVSNFEILNTSTNQDGKYFTFKLDNQIEINIINLKFKENNFDWHVKLEASQNMEEWFQLLPHSRIVSIKNSNTDYSFTELIFEKSMYKYYRVLVKTQDDVNLTGATISDFDFYKKEIYDGRNFPINEIKDENRPKTSIFDIKMNQKTAVNEVEFYLGKDFDFIRPLTIKALTDSVETEKGWKYNFETVYNGTISSFEHTMFQFPTVITNQLRFEVENGDNEEINFYDVDVNTYRQDLIARFTKSGRHYLLFGKEKDTKPKYDIELFSDKIPTTINEVYIDEIDSIEQPKKQTQNPLFENKLWLYIVMGIAIVLMFWFAIKMMKNVEN